MVSLSIRDIFDILKKAFEVVQDIREAPKTIRRASRQIDRLHDRLKERLSSVNGHDGLSSRQLERIKSYLEDYMEDFDEAATITQKWVKHGSVTKGWDRFTAVFKAVFDTIKGEPKMLKDLARSIDKLCHNIHCELADAKAVASQIIFVCQPRNPAQLVSEYMLRQGMTVPQLALPLIQQMPSSTFTGLQLSSVALTMKNTSIATPSGFPIPAAQQTNPQAKSRNSQTSSNQVTNVELNRTPWSASANSGPVVNLRPSANNLMPPPSCAPAAKPSSWNAGYLDQYPNCRPSLCESSNSQGPAPKLLPTVAQPIQQNQFALAMQRPHRPQNIPSRHPIYAHSNPVQNCPGVTLPFQQPSMHAQHSVPTVTVPSLVNQSPQKPQMQIASSSHRSGQANTTCTPGSSSQPGLRQHSQSSSSYQPPNNNLLWQNNRMITNYPIRNGHIFQEPSQAPPNEVRAIHTGPQHCGPWQASQMPTVASNVLPGNSFQNNVQNGHRAEPHHAPNAFPIRHEAVHGQSFLQAPPGNSNTYPRPGLVPNPTGCNLNALPTHQSQAPHSSGVTGPIAQHQGVHVHATKSCSNPGPLPNPGTIPLQPALTATCSQPTGSTRLHTSHPTSTNNNKSGWDGLRVAANANQGNTMNGFNPQASWNQNYQARYPIPMPPRVC